MHFGLLERIGKGEVKVSQTAVDILHPDDEDEKKKALIRAAFSPKLFATLKERFPDDAFASDMLRSFLMRENYLERAINPVIKSYTETCSYLKQEKVYENGGPKHPNGEESDPSDSDERSDEGPVFGGAKVNDLVQWEQGGSLVLEAPARVRAVSDDDEWIWIDGNETGIPMEEVIVEGAATPQKTPPKLPLPPAGDAPPPEGKRRMVFDLDEGEVVLTYPESFSSASVKELDGHLKLFMMKVRRIAGVTDPED